MTTNKRLYFTCPIKVLYMAREFGVKFECKYTPEEIAEHEPLHEFYDFNEAACESNTIEDLLENLKNFRQIYVATESEHIFEPEEGDIGLLTEKWSRGEEYYIVERKHWGNMNFKHNYKWFKGKEEVCTTNKVEITMRENKQFFMPEVENENN